jgi:hypothetical protein
MIPPEILHVAPCSRQRPVLDDLPFAIDTGLPAEYKILDR